MFKSTKNKDPVVKTLTGIVRRKREHHPVIPKGVSGSKQWSNTRDPAFTGHWPLNMTASLEIKRRSITESIIEKEEPCRYSKT